MGHFAGQQVRLPPVSRSDYQPSLPLPTGTAPVAESDGLILLAGTRPFYSGGGLLTVKLQCPPEWLEFRNWVHDGVGIDAAAQNALLQLVGAVVDGGYGILRGELPTGTTWKGHVVRSARVGAILSGTPAVTWLAPDYWTADLVFTVPTGKATLLGGHDNSDRFIVSCLGLGL